MYFMGERYKATICIRMCLFILRISSMKKESTTTRGTSALKQTGFIAYCSKGKCTPWEPWGISVRGCQKGLIKGISLGWIILGMAQEISFTPDWVLSENGASSITMYLNKLYVSGEQIRTRRTLWLVKTQCPVILAGGGECLGFCEWHSDFVFVSA